MTSSSLVTIQIFQAYLVIFLSFLLKYTEQTTDKYDSKQKGGSLSGSIGTGLNTTASVNVNKTEMHSDYQSVDKQTGINAGKGGFDIIVILANLKKGILVINFKLIVFWRKVNGH
ncbi:hypothetical protein [Providencia rettgeri]|uniref:hypothetical protein n=1 Tax=Providencia rettgeri TaxID=587 RepID=UPI002360B0B5|nr:hypothetical protein [Providencia rettgeri]